jgi:cyanophycin synthetase
LFVDTTRSGYRYRSRQPCEILEFPLSTWELGPCDTAQTACEQIDQWFARFLQIQVERLPFSALQGSPPGPWLEHLWRTLLLASVLREGSAEPVFEPGRPLLLRPCDDRGKVRIARVAVPASTRTSKAELASFYQRCAEIIDRLGHRIGDADAEQGALSQCEALVGDHAKRFGGLGKSTFQVLKTAYSMNVPAIALGEAAFQLGWGSRGVLIDRSVTAGDSATGARLAQDKASTRALLHQAGLPVPEHRLARTLLEAESVARRLGWPVVVKPANRDRGEGVSVGVRSLDQLRAAFDTARKLSRQVLVEREVPGVCHRIFIAAGRVLYVVRRDPRCVVGDGVQTVASLIEQANHRNLERPRWQRTHAWPNDALAQGCLRAQGLSLESVPAPGLKVALRPIESVRWGGDDEDMSERIHPDNAQAAIRAARLLRLHNAGIDLMSMNIEQPWHANGGVIIEVNFAPALGTADISRQHVPEFIRRHLQGDGRIAVHAVLGPGHAADRRAIQLSRMLNAKGINCWICWKDRTVDPDGQEYRSTLAGLFDRVRALLLDSRVDALIVRIDDTELLSTGLPVDRLASIEEPDDQWLAADADPGPGQWTRLKNLLVSYLG